MIAKYLKRLLGSAAIAALTIALAYPAFAQTTYKTGTSVNVGQPSSTQLSRDEINQQEQHDELEENTHHEQIDEGLDSQARADAISHDLRIKQLEAAQTPYKPQHIADENEQYADEKKDNAQKKAIEAQRHSQALARIEAAAQALLSGAASALGNALNGGGGSPSGTAPQPNGGASASNPNNGGGSASNPNAGGGSANSPRLSGNASSTANASNASPSGPGAGQRPLDAIPNALNGFVNQFQNGGQNLQNASNAMRGVAQTFEDQWTKPNGGINQVAAMVAFHGIGGAIEALAPAIKSIAGEAGTAAPGILARARAAAPGIAA